MENIRTAYGAEKDPRRRRQLLSLVSGRLTRAQLLKRGWEVKRSEFKRSRRPFCVPRLPPNCKPLSPDARSAIKSFYLDHCQPAGDKTCYDKDTKSTVTVMVRSKTKKQLHSELPGHLRVSYSTFAKLQPRNVRQAKRKTDMCEICVAGQQCTKECEREAKKLRLDDSSGYDPQRHQQLQENVKLFEAHRRVADLQRENYVAARDALKAGQVMIILDFKENLKVGSGPVEVGQDFYQKTQVSCLGCAVHVGRDEGTCSTHYFDALSYCLSHDGLYVREAMRVIIPRILDMAGGSLSDLSFWMDCGPHFRCYEVLYDFLIDLPHCYPIPTIRVNFFAEHHGKSLVDGHFGHVSRAVNRWSLKQRLVDIQDLCSAISEYFPSDSVHPLVLPTPTRSLVAQLKLLQGKAHVKITQNYYFVSQNGTISCSLLSAGTALVGCTSNHSMKVDTRAVKKPPHLEKRTAKATESTETLVGPDTKEKLSTHWQSLKAAGLLS